ncbi:PAS domain-containing protein [Streptomyces yaizuensis]|uniref:PAS domain-containing protein n=1 Tax=Streptomyces yaizuensis TaxID=2989713 RepID=A0ABQ5NZL7_9ACTN|nr:PAS domain-containing protein [Streptomyces sp. YSPA8]GLF95801.1 PAS domain-containing protein [Streptomyces sp. YSPA8]
MSSRPSRGAARLAAILDALPDGLVLVNCNGTVVNANTIALELFEAPGTALVGRGVLDLLPVFDSRLIPGSMRRPEATDERGRTRATRMVARRTDGTEFPVEVTSAGLEDGRDAYASQHGYTGDELLMLVVRDLSGTLDTEAELARSQRQTEMILRAAAEGVVGTDTDGRVVLVNPAAAQILGFRASDLGGQELHPLILHSREDGKPFPYAESPLADTLRSGRKHRVRGQVLWAKNGSRVPVDLTTAPVRDGDQLVGAVMTFTDRRPAESLAKRHAEELERTTERLNAELADTAERLNAEIAENAERFAAELADKSERYTTEIEKRDERHQELAARHEQLTAVLGGSLRGPLEELRTELGTLAADPAGQLWPEANQILHHLAAGYARMTTLIDNVLGFQLLDTGQEPLTKSKVLLDAVVTAGVEGAVELIGPGRAQFAVHAPAIEAEVDAGRLATALAHLAADVAGVDSTGKARLLPDGGYVDSTVVVAAAQRGDVVRIEVRGPFAGGDPVHEPIVRGIVEAHGGVLQTHEMPGMSGSAYVLEVPLGDAAGALVPAPEAVSGGPAPAVPTVPGPDAALPGGPALTGPPAVVAAGVVVAQGPGTAPETLPELLPESLSEAGESLEQDAPVEAAVEQDGPVGTVGEVGLVGPGVSVEPMEPMEPAAGAGSGRRRGRRSSTDAFLESPVSAEGSASGEESSQPTGRRRAVTAADDTASVPSVQLPPARPADPTAAVPDAGTTSDGPVGTGPVGTPSGGTGRRRGRPSPAEGSAAIGTDEENATDAVVTAAEGAAGRAAPGQAVPPGGVPPQPTQSSQPSQPPQSSPSRPVPPGGVVPPQAPPGARGPRPVSPQGVPPQGVPPQPVAPAALGLPQQNSGGPQNALPAPSRPVPPAGMPQPLSPSTPSAPGAPGFPRQSTGTPPGDRPVPPHGGVPELSAVPGGGQGAGPGGVDAQQAGRRTRRALAPAPVEPAEAPGGPRVAFALPPAAADRMPVARPSAGAVDASTPSRHDAVRIPPGADHTPPEHHPLPTGRRRGHPAGPQEDTSGAGFTAVPDEIVPEDAGPTAATDTGPVGIAPAGPAPAGPVPTRPVPADAAGVVGAVREDTGQGVPPSAPDARSTGSVSLPLPDLEPPHPAPVPPGARQPLPAEAPLPRPHPADGGQGRAFSVRTLGQGVQSAAQQTGPQQTGAGPRAPQGSSPVPAQRPAPAAQQTGAQQAGPQQAGAGQAQLGSGRRRKLSTPPEGERPEPAARPQGPSVAQPSQPHASRLPLERSEGRAYAIGAPDEDAAEGPEPLDGPGGAVEVANRPQPHPVDDELPPEPLDNPRRLLVWPAPDVSTQQALSDRGYRPVVVHSREEVDAQIAAFPAALFVDPLTGPITRTALQSLRQAAVAAEVPVLVTAGLGQATREAAYGADPAVLLKALAPRDSEQHPSRVLLIEEHEEIALALTAALERRGMQVARAGADTDAVTLAAQTRPNLVVMDLMQVRRRRAGIIDWLRANGQLNRTPLVVYTSAGLNRAELPRLSSGETVLFLAERSTSAEVQARIVDLLAKIGTN